MHVGIGYSELPDTAAAGRQAARQALEQAGRNRICDFVLLFSTARHDAGMLREAVASVLGASVPVYGGGTAGAISNTAFGYAGGQVILAAMWLERTRCEITVEGGLTEDEIIVGERLGRKLNTLGVSPESPVLLFYDSMDMTSGAPRMVMATYLLEGIEQGLGFLPDLVGAGLIGDHANTPVPQWTGPGLSCHNALALSFGGDIRVDSVIMHGCKPSTGYYTVTKADKQTILEINGQPAIQFLETLLGSAVPPENFPFFLILGVNKGEKWKEFDESSYASRLCLAIDKKRGGIVMFEPDMVAGTEFQIMYRSLDLGYVPPKIEEAFEGLKGRKPVFALYINCAGRAAGYSGIELEDAVAVQDTVAGRAPLLGIYTGVEIATVLGRPRGLDWTGIFCLFSVQHER